MTLKLVYPALAMVLWIFVVLTILFLRRKAAFDSKQVTIADVSVSTTAYPEPARLAAANFTNQFETPVVFFALIMLAMEVGATSYVMAGLAWAYVATRVVHTLVHVGANQLKLRGSVFALGILVLLCMWIGVVLAVL
ncbi:MAPEG family protein [Bosea sp. (in: a-proteobacteria)]|uniref:MAPEG family protein n=1 Tax=Bosea sp. (in: a-proteobacteria) TaxID=1871050 RepID=UPI002733A56B|nr:MAPEG family protein [Bosea sp. (in: a-proteobacteria)]MDP3408026.1 MAPEG family protein [Bosea sp. (in: a-proteobacteria)]